MSTLRWRKHLVFTNLMDVLSRTYTKTHSDTQLNDPCSCGTLLVACCKPLSVVNQVTMMETIHNYPYLPLRSVDVLWCWDHTTQHSATTPHNTPLPHHTTLRYHTTQYSATTSSHNTRHWVSIWCSCGVFSDKKGCNYPLEYNDVLQDKHHH